MSSAIRRFWWLGVGVFAVCVLGSAILAFAPSEKFEASSTIVVRPSEELGSNVQGIRFVLPSLAEEAQSPAVFNALTDSLPSSLLDADWDVTVDTDAESLIMIVTASSGDRDVPVPIANRFAEAVVAEQEADQLVILRTLDQASEVRSTAGARSVLLTAGVALGLVAGVLAILGAQALRPRVWRPQDVRALDLNMLGEVPRQPGPLPRPARVFSDRETEDLAEAFERIRINLDARRPVARVSAIAVTSIGEGEGKTTVTACLAWGIGALDHSVTAVDADLRDPQLHASFGLPNRSGLADVRDGDPTWVAPVVTELPALSVLPAGRLDHHPSDILNNGLAAVLSEVDVPGARILIDTPALDTAADALLVASVAGAAVLVVESERRSPTEVRRAADQLSDAGAEVLGVILTRTRRPPSFKPVRAPRRRGGERSIRTAPAGSVSETRSDGEAPAN
ncbi:MAG: cellulose synthase operon protein YhjQ/BcsQ [Dehalococcoidia bacterium]